MDGSPSKIEPNRKRQKTGGRKKGSTNKATRDIKALAQKYGPDALLVLRGIMRGGETDAARVAAAKELLDRGYGKAPQSMSVELGANERLLSLIEAGMARASHR